jgi:hypothetical protein
MVPQYCGARGILAGEQVQPGGLKQPKILTFSERNTRAKAHLIRWLTGLRGDREARSPARGCVRVPVWSIGLTLGSWRPSSFLLGFRITTVAGHSEITFIRRRSERSSCRSSLTSSSQRSRHSPPARCLNRGEQAAKTRSCRMNHSLAVAIPMLGPIDPGRCRRLSPRDSKISAKRATDEKCDGRAGRSTRSRLSLTPSRWS